MSRERQAHEETVAVTEPALPLNLKQLYRPGMTGTALYDTRRGVWRLNPARAAQATLALGVANSTIVAVYQITAWYRANTTPYASGRQDQAHPDNACRYEFTGTNPPQQISQKYLGQRIALRGQNPVSYRNC